MCERWRNSFHEFINDIGPCPGKEYTIDRINNDGNYEPGNVRWATKKEQANNRRSNRILTFEGISMTMAQWAESKGISPLLVERRLNVFNVCGWSVEDALTKPIRKDARHGPEFSRKLKIQCHQN